MFLSVRTASVLGGTSKSPHEHHGPTASTASDSHPPSMSKSFPRWCVLPGLAAFALLAAAVTGDAQVPQIINYQGRITVGPTPFTGTGQFRFALVNGDGTVTYWSNDATSNAGSQPTASVALP